MCIGNENFQSIHSSKLLWVLFGGTKSSMHFIRLQKFLYSTQHDECHHFSPLLFKWYLALEEIFTTKWRLLMKLFGHWYEAIYLRRKCGERKFYVRNIAENEIFFGRNFITTACALANVCVFREKNHFFASSNEEKENSTKI